jgi:hypothetical protein
MPHQSKSIQINPNQSKSIQINPPLRIVLDLLLYLALLVAAAMVMARPAFQSSIASNPSTADCQSISHCVPSASHAHTHTHTHTHTPVTCAVQVFASSWCNRSRPQCSNRPKRHTRLYWLCFGQYLRLECLAVLSLACEAHARSVR